MTRNNGNPPARDDFKQATRQFFTNQDGTLQVELTEVEITDIASLGRCVLVLGDMRSEEGFARLVSLLLEAHGVERERAQGLARELLKALRANLEQIEALRIINKFIEDHNIELNERQMTEVAFLGTGVWSRILNQETFVDDEGTVVNYLQGNRTQALQLYNAFDAARPRMLPPDGEPQVAVATMAPPDNEAAPVEAAPPEERL